MLVVREHKKLVLSLVAAGVVGAAIIARRRRKDDCLKVMPLDRAPFLHNAVDAVHKSPVSRHLFLMLTASARRMGLSLLLSCFAALWLISVYLRNVSIVDSFWSLGFLLMAWVYRQHSDSAQGYIGRKNMVLITTVCWALRLSVYITWRNYAVSEDYRYRAMRKRFGHNFWFISLFQTFFLQAILCFIISQVLLVAQVDGPEYFTLFDKAGIVMWLIGFFFEMVGDLQLARFKAKMDNKGKLMTEGKQNTVTPVKLLLLSFLYIYTGLWRYSRHPNYFGNACMFWGFYLFAVSVKGGWKHIYSPALMTFLLVQVSGVALLERSLRKTKPGYARYVANTSAFIPWFPKDSRP